METDYMKKPYHGLRKQNKYSKDSGLSFQVCHRIITWSLQPLSTAGILEQNRLCPSQPTVVGPDKLLSLFVPQLSHQ